MKPPRLSDLPPEAAERVRRLLRASAKATAQQAAGDTKRSADNPAWRDKETGLQHDAAAMLRGRGYWPRDKRHILRDQTGRIGWQVHVFRAIGNPYLLDILLLRPDRPPLEIELKTERGKPSDIQAVLLAVGGKLCRSVEDVEQVVDEWERKEG